MKPNRLLLFSILAWVMACCGAVLASDRSFQDMPGTLAVPDFFTEWFESSDNDLDNHVVTFTPDDSGNFYRTSCAPTNAFPSSADGTVVPLSDDGYGRVSLVSGAQVKLYGVCYTSFYVGANGYLTFGAGDSDYSESLKDHFALPRISGLFDDLNPPAGGTITWAQMADRVVVTFLDISEVDVSNQNSFQFELFYDSVIRVTYLNIAATDGLAGLSAGDGIPAGFVESDLTAYPPWMPRDALTVEPGDGLAASGEEGGPFAPGSKAYTISNSGGTVFSWTASIDQTWIGVSPSGGTLGAGGSATVTVSIAAGAASLASGDYAGTVTFSNTVSGVIRPRPVTLAVTPFPRAIEVLDSISPNSDRAMPFGKVIVGQSRTEHITVTNLAASHDLMVTNLAVRRAGTMRVQIPAAARTKAANAPAISLDRAPPAKALDPMAGTLAAPSTVPCYGVDLDANQLVSFSSATPGTLSNIGGTAGNLYACDFLNGDFSRLFVLDNASKQLVTVNTATAARTTIGTATPVAGHTWTGLAGDSTDGTLYAASSDGSSSKLYRIDPATGVATLIGDVTDAPGIIGIAVNDAGAMFGVDIALDSLVSINKSTGAATAIGALGIDAQYAQGLDFDEENDVLYWAAYSEEAGGELRVIDTTTGASSAVAPFANSHELEMAVANGGEPVFRLENMPALPHTVAPGGRFMFDVVYEPARMGSNTSAVVIESNAANEPKLAVALSGEGVLDYLVLTPETGWVASGHPGGPFSPTSAVYRLKNDIAAPVQWKADSMESWLRVSPSSGTLGAGEDVSVTVSLAAAADGLAEGVHTGTVLFSDETTGIVQSRPMTLRVNTSPQLTVNPASLCVTNRLGEATERPLTLGNAAGADGALDFTLTTRETGQMLLAKAAEGVGLPDPARDFRKPAPGAVFVPGELLVRFKPKVEKSARAALAQALGGARIAKEHRLVPGLCKVKLGVGQDVGKALAAFNVADGVLYAEPNYIYKASLMPNDARAGEQWGMNNTGQTGGTPDADIDAPEAWSLHTGSDSIIVGVIDTGLDYTHEDLVANTWQNPGEIAGNGLDDDSNGYVDDVHGINAITGSGDPLDDHGHGTHCSGTIGGRGNNAVGVAGVCWTVKIMGLKFLDAGGYGNSEDAITCIDYAVSMGVKVLSNSWGGGGYSQALKDAIDAAGAAGVVFTAAAGNDYGLNNDWYPSYPASYDSENIVAVLSTDHNDELSDFSNYGPLSVDIGAPGSSILSCMRGGGYALMSGTSMATPHISGACALLFAKNPMLSVAELKHILLNTVDPVVPGTCVSGGRVNVARALAEAGSPWLSVTPAEGTGIGQGSSMDVTVRFDAANREAGTYSGDVRVTCNDLKTPQTNVPCVMVILPDALQLSPANPFAASGMRGGPYEPASAIYVVSNSGPGSLDWSVTHAAAWLDVTPTGGTLVAGQRTEVTVAMNASANVLLPGDYADTLAFANTGTGATRYRTATLTVDPLLPEVFLSQPFDTDPGWTAQGQWAFGAPQGLGGDPSSGHTGANVYGYNLAGTYANYSPVYFLTTTPMDCSGKTGVTLSFWRWLGVESSSYDHALLQVSNNNTNWVTIWNHTGATLLDTAWTLVSYDISAVADEQPKVYVRWGMGPMDSSVSYCGWNIDDLCLTGSGAASFTTGPETGLVSSGYAGGPFTPAGKTYTLSNLGESKMSWRVHAGADWVDVQPAAGVLPALSSTTVVVSIAGAAVALTPGTYETEVVFADTDSSTEKRRTVSLRVKPVPGEIGVSDTIQPAGDRAMPFGQAFAGQTRTEHITVSNTDGSHDLVLTELALRRSGIARVRIPAVAPSEEKSVSPVSIGRAPVTVAVTPMAGTLAAPSTVPCYGVDLDANQLVSFSSAAPGALTNLGSTAGSLYACDFLNGDFSRLFVLDDASQELVTVNTLTAARTTIGTATPAAGHTWTGLAGDSTDGTLYAASTDGSASTLYRIDPETGSATVIGDIAGAPAIIAIAVNDSGELYGVDISLDSLVSIDKDTGAGTVIGALGIDAQYAQGLDFDEENDVLYWAAYSATAGGELRVIDTATGASSAVAPFEEGHELEMAVANGGVAMFRLENTPALPRTVAPGDGFTFDVIYEPMAAGSNATAVVIASNDADEPKAAVALSGFVNNATTVVTDRAVVTVPEGGTATFGVKLNARIYGDLAVAVSAVGDTSLTVAEGAGLTFTPANWDTYQTVTLAAAEDDGDDSNGTAAITCSGSGVTHAVVAAMESDDDYTLSVTAMNGTVVRTLDTPLYDHGASVSLEAVQHAGYHFTGWSGCATGMANPISVTMTSNTSVTATFALNAITILTDRASLAIPEGGSTHFQIKLSAQPTGDTVIAVARTFGDTDIGITSGGTLTFTPDNWADYQTVTVQALENDGANGNGFAIVTCSGAGLTSATVEASEIDDDYTLSVTAMHGTVVKSPDRSLYEQGTDVTLTAAENVGYRFIGWSGDASGLANPVTVIMNGDKNVTANFAWNAVTVLTDRVTATVPEGGSASFLVKLNVQPTGVTVVAVARTAGDADVTVTGGASLTFSTENWDTYQVVTVAAAEDDSDNQSGTATITCSGSGISNAVVAVVEADDDYILTVTSLYGTVVRSPDAPYYDHGTVVSLRATPDPAYFFKRYSGDLIVSNKLASMTMDANKTVTAEYGPTAPKVLPPSRIARKSFVARWNWVEGGAPEGQVCVARDNAFSDAVAGYRDRYVVNVTELMVTNLVAGRDYRYRVRRVMPDGSFGPWSAAMKVRTGTGMPVFKNLLSEVAVAKGITQELAIRKLVAGSGALTVKSSNTNAVRTSISAGLLTLQYLWNTANTAKVTMILTHPTGYQVAYGTVLSRAEGRVAVVGRSALTNAGTRLAQEVILENQTGKMVYGVRIRTTGLYQAAWWINQTGFDPVSKSPIREFPCVFPAGSRMAVRLVYEVAYGPQYWTRPATHRAWAVMPPANGVGPVIREMGIGRQAIYDGLWLLGMPANRNRLFSVYHSDNGGATWTLNVPVIRATANCLMWLDTDEGAPEGRLYRVVDAGI